MVVNKMGREIAARDIWDGNVSGHGGRKEEKYFHVNNCPSPHKYMGRGDRGNDA